MELSLLGKLLSVPFSTLKSNENAYEAKLDGILSLLKEQNKMLISYAQKSEILILELQEQNKTYKDFYSKTRGAGFLEEFITYQIHLQKTTKYESEKPFVVKIKEFLGGTDEFKDAENLIKDYIELNEKFANIIFNSRKHFRTNKNVGSSIQQTDVTEILNARIKITNLFMEFLKKGAV